MIWLYIILHSEPFECFKCIDYIFNNCYLFECSIIGDINSVIPSYWMGIEIIELKSDLSQIMHILHNYVYKNNNIHVSFYEL